MKQKLHNRKSNKLSSAERVSMVGLLRVAQALQASLEDIERDLLEITQETDIYGGFTFDAIFNADSTPEDAAKELMSSLGLK